VGVPRPAAGDDRIPPTVAWHDGRLRLIDQRGLPHRLRFVECVTVDEVCGAIANLTVRGAPALGATAAYGVALALFAACDGGDPIEDAAWHAAAKLMAVRPTAVNLERGARDVAGAAIDAVRAGQSARAAAGVALAEAHRIAADDVTRNRAIGTHGNELVPPGARVLTHCNAGALACVGYGTALGVVRAAAAAGKHPHVWVGETRPVLQGARLTAWELRRLRIPCTVLPDAAAGSLFASREIDLVIVGADRIAANGDVANKIGTYPLAVLAAQHEVPFYVAAPVATIDRMTPTGDGIVVEDRPADEVVRIAGRRIAPRGVTALNRAFDITPAAFVQWIITEHGLVAANHDAVRRVVERD
jgi:methylthioribose-1-phosphate isomerase